MKTYTLTARKGTDTETKTFTSSSAAHSIATRLRNQGWKVKVEKKEGQ